jgi:hypothetical protein
MINEAKGDDEAPVRIEELLHQRKVAYARWSFGKNSASYRGVEFSLVGGPDEDEIELDGGVFDALEDVFDYLDVNMEGDDEEGVAEALNLAWDEWMESDEARMVHVGQHQLDGSW